MINSDVVNEIRRVRPRSVVYLFSGGKDSSIALVITRNIVRDLCKEINCKVYIVHIIVTGNSLPANTWCSQYIMKWHERNYGFIPVTLAASKSFPDLVCRYGFQIMSGRWCYTEFKEKPLRSFEQAIPRPILEIDGMSPGDSRWRAEVIKSEFEYIDSGYRSYYSWHPLYSLNMDSKQRLEMLKQYNEFECVVNLYKVFNDSMNCVICPYKSKEKIMKLSGADPLATVYWSLIDYCVRSDRWKDKFSILSNGKKIVEYLVR